MLGDMLGELVYGDGDGYFIHNPYYTFAIGKRTLSFGWKVGVQSHSQKIVGGGPTASHFLLLVQKKVTKENTQTAPFEAIRPHCVGVGS